MPIRKTVAWVSICTACVAGAEGLRQVAYLDVGGVPTICFGETKNVHINDKKTADECKDMLAERVLEFGEQVDKCTIGYIPPERKAAYTSLAYNIGPDAFCRSTLVKKNNAGDIVGACDEFLRWNKVKGVPWPGLTARREKERQLCLKGVT